MRYLVLGVVSMLAGIFIGREIQKVIRRSDRERLEELKTEFTSVANEVQHSVGEFAIISQAALQGTMNDACKARIRELSDKIDISRTKLLNIVVELEDLGISTKVLMEQYHR